jgi:hypothetical protein
MQLQISAEVGRLHLHSCTLYKYIIDYMHERTFDLKQGGCNCAELADPIKLVYLRSCPFMECEPTLQCIGSKVCTFVSIRTIENS